MKKITEMEWFSKLTTQQKIEVLNLKENFVGLGKSTNASKGALDWLSWQGHSVLGEVPDIVRSQMLDLEKNAISALIDAINERLK